MTLKEWAINLGAYWEAIPGTYCAVDLVEDGLVESSEKMVW